ncbi:protein of unknown function [Colwellia chukchiensis]|uniref:DUF4258 domain-containing protein n=1 Tax=Colwellia chukchiensis TaxID=641665 RepID=A0A1H7Q2V2_9GAMM|nr:DUF4258 domain-containing protein [Colwellia chukchiensis]SEL42139.1 protein of unknown function [Colwellia chukchiensis]
MYTNHAYARMQQRGIQPVEIEAVLDFGQCEFHQGCEIFSVRKSAAKKLLKLGKLPHQLLAKMHRIYVVTKGDLIITVGHRYKRLKKERK